LQSKPLRKAITTNRLDILLCSHFLYSSPLEAFGRTTVFSGADPAVVRWSKVNHKSES